MISHAPEPRFPAIVRGVSIRNHSLTGYATCGTERSWHAFGRFLIPMLSLLVGFLYMSSFLHAFLTASQYIAPLMANFDTTLDHEDVNSEIYYKKFGE